MSWSDARVWWRGRSAFRSLSCLAIVAIAGCGLTGCADGSGFQPLYATTSGGSRVQEKLAKVQISSMPTRVGQRIRNELIFENTGGGHADTPSYRLDIVVKEQTLAMLVNTTGVASSSIYAVDASFQLIDIKTKRVLLSGTSNARSAYDRYNSIYANVRALEDAQNRAAGVVAQDMKSRLTAFLSSDKV